MGVRRISVGGALARAAWGGFIRTAKLIAGRVAAGEPIKCADRQSGSRELSLGGAAQLTW